MAYNKAKLYEQALKIASNTTMIFIEDIIAMLPCDKTTFYKHFPIDSNENNTIKKKIENNKVIIKNNLKKRWYDGKNFSAEIVLYKLCANKQELEALSMIKNNDTDEKEIKVEINTPK
jgi:hypothetical protein